MRATMLVLSCFSVCFMIGLGMLGYFPWLVLFTVGCAVVYGAIWSVGKPAPWRPAREHCGSRAHFMGLPCPCQDARDD